MGIPVPEVLVSGNHKEVEKWRKEQSRILTEKSRPDLAEIKKNEHEMKLKSRPFEMIKSGYKSIEIRLYDEKRQKVKAGDRIIFTEEESGEKISARVKSIIVFNNFKELFGAFDKRALGYAEDEEKNYEDMTKYYSKREQKKYKAVAIELTEIADE